MNDAQERSKPNTPFENWKSLLRKDCELQDKRLAFQALGDSVLEILWEMGLSPTVQALTEGTSELPPPDTTRERQLTAPTAHTTSDTSNLCIRSKNGNTQ